MAKIKLRRDTYTNWYNANPILGLGEPSFDTTNKAFKVGDGLTVWRNLNYTSGVDTTKLPLSGGTLTGDLTGTNADFASVSALNFYGNGSGLTNLTIGSFLSSSGGTLTGGLTGTNSVFASVSATKFYGDGSGLTGIAGGGGGASIGSTIVGNGTILLVPDSSLSAISNSGAFGDGGQYLIVDPTSPADIHIRAGGPIDQAAASLILGGEKANVTVRNQTNSYIQHHHVIINAENVDGTHYSWTFGPSGTIVFPTLQVDLHNGGVQTGQVLQFGNPDQQVIITGPKPAANTNAQRLIIQGQRATGSGEGGDVYFWGGDADANGGDIKIYAGDADGAEAGYGGYVNIDAGRGFNQGGNVSIQAGYSDELGGGVSISSGYGSLGGGNVTIEAAGSPEVGGNVNITAGTGSTESGYVALNTSSLYQWKFDKDGSVSLPGKVIASSVSKNAGSNTGTIAIDLNKQINRLKPWGNGGPGPITGDQYTLADGVEGQILYLVPQSGYNSGDEFTTVKLAKARYKNATGDIVQETNVDSWLPFGSGTQANYNALVTLIFTDGYWNLPHSIFVV